MSRNHEARFREIDSGRKSEFVQLGYKGRYFFPHRFYHLPKCGPDGFKLAQRMCGEQDPNQLSELVLYAAADIVREFPMDVFFDDELNWHQQQFGRPGQVATANLRVNGDDLYSMVHLSDLVQRIARRPDCRSRIENRFKGWPRLLMNAILALAVERNCKRVLVPTSALAMTNTDPKRSVGADLFERIYDLPLALLEASRADGWWVLDVEQNKRRAVMPRICGEPLANPHKVICIFHDIERGLGHVDCDPGFAEAADKSSAAHLQEMAEIENSLGVRATYNVVGSILNDVRPLVEQYGHEVAFHSYNHVIADEQLGPCRSLDYRIKGYRPPQSRIVEELTDAALVYHNFEWLASSARSLGFTTPTLENGIVKIPIHIDDFSMYSESVSFSEWEQQVLQKLKAQQFVALGLHDCYGEFWLPHYHAFLRKISEFGVLRTMNQVACDVIFKNSF